MDFSSLLAKEISKKKNQVESVAGGESKVLLRSDLVRQREEKYLEKQRQVEQARISKDEEVKRKRQEEHDAREAKLRRYEESKRATKTPEPQTKGSNGTNETESAKLQFTDQEVTDLLRSIGRPSKMFGESLEDRIRRLKKAQAKIERAKQKQLDEEQEQATDFMVDGEDIKKKPDLVSFQLYVYIKHLLKAWGEVLAESESRSSKSDNILTETKSFLKPLLKQLKNKSLDQQIFPLLATLLMYLQQRKYRQATDMYMQLSIGNAAWPIGVTAVGIHARSSSERITGIDNEIKPSIQIANIMNDDTTRKWLTAIKRMITFAEGNI